MIIFFIRHGETEFNKEKRYQGQLDIPLSKEGKAKIRKAGFSPKKVYVTTLKRTRQTADLIFPDAEKIEVDGLKEMDFGRFEGRNYEEMSDDKEYRAWIDSECAGRCPGGESKEEFQERTCKALNELIEKTAEAGEDLLAIVAHGGTIMASLEKMAFPGRSYYSWLPGNAEGFLLEYVPENAPHILKCVTEVRFHNAKSGFPGGVVNI
ncbi:MAG: histidine phosphatase family protein [Lachnospiraceae bacterium]|nr:histidine phosphatase family protein [Lachnospiraceae bacterium]